MRSGWLSWIARYSVPASIPCASAQQSLLLRPCNISLRRDEAGGAAEECAVFFAAALLMNLNTCRPNRRAGRLRQWPLLRPAVQRWTLGWLLFLLILPMPVRAQENAGTNTNSVEEIPPLRPPRDQLPPTFWEEHQRPVILTTAVGILVVLAMVFLFTRPRRVIPTPPEVVARQAL